MLLIIMKGYKREFDDIKVVEIGFKNEKLQLNTENLGDEALMLLENLDPVTYRQRVAGCW